MKPHVNKKSREMADLVLEDVDSSAMGNSYAPGTSSSMPQPVRNARKRTVVLARREILRYRAKGKLDGDWR
jgi:hypothetical protein